jgi:hypothetical protein
MLHTCCGRSWNKSLYRKTFFCFFTPDAPLTNKEKERANEEAACCKVALGIDENEWARENIYNIVDCPTTIRAIFQKKKGWWWRKWRRWKENFEQTLKLNISCNTFHKFFSFLSTDDVDDDDVRNFYFDVWRGNINTQIDNFKTNVLYFSSWDFLCVKSGKKL